VLVQPGAGRFPRVIIRDFEDDDWPVVWPVVEDIARAQDTFAYDPDMSEDEGRREWVVGPPGRTVVAVEGDRVLGTAHMGPNRRGPGAHIATASFMVAADARGRGVGSTLCRFALGWARDKGYAGMQFNAVVESNHPAVAVYRRLGFEIVGTVPGAFRHPALGPVGLHVMYCDFSKVPPPT
jgi:GNAT superfamily N-acetyltransferase